MKFHRVYIELTNQCGLSCSFCPTKTLPAQTMSLEVFDKILSEVSRYTKEIACHVMGDPMTLGNLPEYLNLLEAHNLKALLTTSGYFVKKQQVSSLMHSAIKQINISMNSFNKNDTSITLRQYLTPILSLCQDKQELSPDMFINLRVWNLDESMSEYKFNTELFQELSNAFGIDLDIDLIYKQRPKNIRLDYKTLLHFDSYFQWPSLNNPIYPDTTCQGLSSHIAILVSGEVVPCCLDADGIMNLGNLTTTSLETILVSSKAQEIRRGLKLGTPTEELCKRCSYRERFKI